MSRHRFIAYVATSLTSSGSLNRFSHYIAYGTTSLNRLHHLRHYIAYVNAALKRNGAEPNRSITMPKREEFRKYVEISKNLDFVDALNFYEF